MDKRIDRDLGFSPNPFYNMCSKRLILPLVFDIVDPKHFFFIKVQMFPFSKMLYLNHITECENIENGHAIMRTMLPLSIC